MNAQYIEKKALADANFELADIRMASSKEDINEGILDLEYLYEKCIKHYNLCLSRKDSSFAAFGSNEAEALYEITYATQILEDLILLKKRLIELKASTFQC